MNNQANIKNYFVDVTVEKYGVGRNCNITCILKNQGYGDEEIGSNDSLVESVMSLNNLSHPGLLVVGSKLRVPAKRIRIAC